MLRDIRSSSGAKVVEIFLGDALSASQSWAIHGWGWQVPQFSPKESFTAGFEVMSHHRLGGQHGVVWLQVSYCFKHVASWPGLGGGV